MADRRQIVALGGYSGAGKTTLFRMMQEIKHGPCIRFAAGIYRAAEAIWGFSYHQLHGAGKDEVDPRWDITPRQALVDLGVRHARGLCANVHTERWKETVRNLSGLGLLYVDNVRFPDELAAVRELGGELVWVDRPGLGPGEDASERSVSYHDFETVLDNSGDLRELEQAAQAILDGLR